MITVYRARPQSMSSIFISFKTFHLLWDIFSLYCPDFIRYIFLNDLFAWNSDYRLKTFIFTFSLTICVSRYRILAPNSKGHSESKTVRKIAMNSCF